MSVDEYSVELVNYNLVGKGLQHAAAGAAADQL